MIGPRRIGPGQPVFIIAEAGVNHNGDVRLARQLIDAAAEAGADAVKFQTFTAERLVAPGAPKADYQRRTTDGTESQLEMLRHLELSEETHRSLWAHCQQRHLLFMSTPFDEASADLLEALGMVVFKIPSGEITNLPLLAHVARKGKPMIVSTGMSTLEEVLTALQTIRQEGARDIVLLHCVSEYPADPADANLLAMHTLRDSGQVPVGFSDHTPGIEVALAAVALGACVIEKHLTLDHNLPGPDHAASLQPQQFRALVRGIRVVESALGHGRKEPSPRELKNAAVIRKSLVAARDIQQGTTLTQELIAIKRPGTGLAPALRSQMVGRTVVRDVPAGTLLTWAMLR